MKLVRSAVLVTAAVAVAMAPAAALADTSGHRDAAGDMRSVAFDSTTNQVVETPSTAEPNARLNDITKVGVVHGSTTITVRIKFRDIAPAGFGQFHDVALVSPKRNRIVSVSAFPGHWGGKVTTRKPNGAKVACAAHAHIDYAHNVVLVKVPRSCLGRPSVVRVGVFSQVGYGSKVFYDDGFALGGEYNDPFALSPRVHR